MDNVNELVELIGSTRCELNRLQGLIKNADYRLELHLNDAMWTGIKGKNEELLNSTKIKLDELFA